MVRAPILPRPRANAGPWTNRSTGRRSRSTMAERDGDGEVGLDRRRLAAFASRLRGEHVDARDLEVQPLRGGLEAAAVARVAAHFRDGTGRLRSFTFVAKRLDDSARREAAIYAHALEPHAPGVAPRLLGSEDASPGVTYLYLEHIRPSRAWPWREVALAGLVLERLAAIHARLPPGAFAAVLVGWDYEGELLRSAEATLEQFERAVAHEDLAWLRWARGALRRTVAALPEVRAALVGAAPLGVAVLHGDVHSGNVMVRTGEEADPVVLLDWGRARLGSPLEDVSSWLQSLGYWEPEAKRRHDTLLRRYLAARGLSRELTRELRRLYWLAGACNVFAGALRYHLAVADGLGGAPSRSRAEAARLARDQLRVIRRADAAWRG